MKVSSEPEPVEKPTAQPPAQSQNAPSEKALRVCGPSGTLALRYGLPCPFCLVGRVDYDSQLNLVCSKCGKTQTGVFT